MAYPGFDGETLVPGMLTGFRSWRVMSLVEHPVLRSVSYEYDWVPGVNDATCMADKNSRRMICTNPDHGATSKAPMGGHNEECFVIGQCTGVEGTCQCGFYAYMSDNETWYTPTSGATPSGTGTYTALSGMTFISGGYTPAATTQCHGIIDGYGRCVVGPKGFRSSHAIIRALVLPITMPAKSGLDPAAAEQVRDDAGAQLANDHPFARIYPTVEAMRGDNPLSTHSLIEGTDQP